MIGANIISIDPNSHPIDSRSINFHSTDSVPKQVPNNITNLVPNNHCYSG